MNKSLKIVKLDSNYCDYLRNFDSKVPYNAHKIKIDNGNYGVVNLNNMIPVTKFNYIKLISKLDEE